VVDAPDLLDKKPSAAAAGLPIALGGGLAGFSWLCSSLIVYFVYFMYVFANVVARVERLACKLGAQSAVRM
jgi:apolipoprotein N-acyltransferase